LAPWKCRPLLQKIHTKEICIFAKEICIFAKETCILKESNHHCYPVKFHQIGCVVDVYSKFTSVLILENFYQQLIQDESKATDAHRRPVNNNENNRRKKAKKKATH